MESQWGRGPQQVTKQPVSVVQRGRQGSGWADAYGCGDRGRGLREQRVSQFTRVLALPVDTAPWTTVGKVIPAAGGSRVWLG